MSSVIESLAKKILPKRVAVTIQCHMSRAHQKRLLRASGEAEAVKILTRQFGWAVLHGPFRGLRYTPEALLSRQGLPRLLGTYELELHPVFESMNANRYERIIDIGCAEGYYAVGLARNTKATVYAFDADRQEKALCRGMAAANGVETRVVSGSWCTPSVLMQIATDRTLVISDCEGFEVDLFTAEVAKRLARADLIIELHEKAGGSDVEKLILQRFRDSHAPELFTFSPTNVLDIPELKIFPPGEIERSRENRPLGQRWVHLRSKIRSN